MKPARATPETEQKMTAGVSGNKIKTPKRLKKNALILIRLYKTMHWAARQAYTDGPSAFQLLLLLFCCWWCCLFVCCCCCFGGSFLFFFFFFLLATDWTSRNTWWYAANVQSRLSHGQWQLNQLPRLFIERYGLGYNWGSISRVTGPPHVHSDWLKTMMKYSSQYCHRLAGFS